MIGGVDFTAQRIGSFYNKNQNLLADTLMRLSSGKRFQGPGDDIAGYVRVQALESDATAYRRINESLKEYQGVLDTALTGGEEIYDALTRLDDLATLHSQTSDSTEKDGYNQEFTRIANDLAGMINSMVYRGTALSGEGTGATHTITTIDLDPGSGTQNLTIQLSDMMDATTLEAATGAGGMAANIDTAMSSVKSFLADANALQRQVTSQVNVTDSMIQTHEAAVSAIEDIDEAEEMSNYTEQDIRGQAAIAMMAQANVSKRAILALYQ